MKEEDIKEKAKRKEKEMPTAVIDIAMVIFTIRLQLYWLNGGEFLRKQKKNTEDYQPTTTL